MTNDTNIPPIKMLLYAFYLVNARNNFVSQKSWYTETSKSKEIEIILLYLLLNSGIV